MYCYNIQRHMQSIYNDLANPKKRELVNKLDGRLMRVKSDDKHYECVPENIEKTFERKQLWLTDV